MTYRTFDASFAMDPEIYRIEIAWNGWCGTAILRWYGRPEVTLSLWAYDPRFETREGLADFLAEILETEVLPDPYLASKMAPPDEEQEKYEEDEEDERDEEDEGYSYKESTRIQAVIDALRTHWRSRHALAKQSVPSRQILAPA